MLSPRSASTACRSECRTSTPTSKEAINRVQTREQTERLVNHARSKGYRGINVDLIYGLPLQTPETFEKTVDSW